MDFKDLNIKTTNASVGLSLYSGEEYLATYTSMNCCIMDLVYRFNLKEFDELFAGFRDMKFGKGHPYRYRGVCTELFLPTESITRYVCYSNSMGDLLAQFEEHEQRAIKYPKYFLYGVSGMGIHIFDYNELQYKFWVGDSSIKTLSDLIIELRNHSKDIPDSLFDEYSKSLSYDVFISHKSEDYVFCKKIYDFLQKKKLKVFFRKFLCRQDQMQIIGLK